MKKQKITGLWLIKMFLVLLMIFMQFDTPILAIAEEIENNTTVAEENNNDQSDTTPEIKEEQTTENSDTELSNNEEKEPEEITSQDEQQDEQLDTNNDTETVTEEKKEEPTNTEEQQETTNTEEQKETSESDEQTDTETTTSDETTTEQETNTDNQTEENNTSEEQSQEQNTENKVTINDIETKEYTLKDNENTVTVKIATGDVAEEHQIDFSNKLAGTYEFEFDVTANSSKEKVSITKNGNNVDVLSNLLTGNQIANKEVEFKANSLIIPGSSTPLDEGNIIASIDVQQINDNYNATIEVTCPEESTTITSECVLSIKYNDPNVGYTTEDIQIKILGDYNTDGIADYDDATILVEKLLSNEDVSANIEDYDLNGDGKFDILDASHNVFFEGNWANNAELTDNLTNELENEDTVNKDDAITINYYIKGVNANWLDGVSGKLNYDKDKLELTNVTINENATGGVNDNDEFMYILGVDEDVLLMTLTFKAIGAGDANFSIDKITAATFGQKLNIEESVSTTITVTDYGKGGDADEEAPEENPTTEQQPETKPQETPETTTNVQPVVDTVVPYINVLSSDNLIKSLEAKGYEINFDPNVLEYSITAKNFVTALDLVVVLNDDRATYVVNGNKDFKVGENIVEIVVTAENGDKRTYKIKVTREAAANKKDKTEEEEENKNSSKGIIIALIVLVIIGLIYVIFKDDEEEK